MTPPRPTSNCSAKTSAPLSTRTQDLTPSRLLLCHRLASSQDPGAPAPLQPHLASSPCPHPRPAEGFPSAPQCGPSSPIYPPISYSSLAMAMTLSLNSASVTPALPFVSSAPASLASLLFLNFAPGAPPAPLLNVHPPNSCTVSAARPLSSSHVSP